MFADSFDRLSPQPDDLVFLSPQGLSMNDNTFRRRAWKKILASCQIEYRSPYNLRHTAASYHLANKYLQIEKGGLIQWNWTLLQSYLINGADCATH